MILENIANHKFCLSVFVQVYIMDVFMHNNICYQRIIINDN